MNYVAVQVKTGYEEKVKKQLNGKFIVLNPIDSIESFKKGKNKKRNKTLFPGYVFVKTELKDHIWHLIKNTIGVIQILGEVNKEDSLSLVKYESSQIVTEIIEVEAIKEEVHFTKRMGLIQRKVEIIKEKLQITKLNFNNMFKIEEQIRIFNSIDIGSDLYIKLKTLII